MKKVYFLLIPLLWIQPAFTEDAIKLRQDYEASPSIIEMIEMTADEGVTATKFPKLFIQNGSLMGTLTQEQISNTLNGMSNCINHTYPRVFDFFGETMRQINCIDKSIDKNIGKSIGKICAEEKKLNALAKTYGNDAASMEQIEEYQDAIEYLKEELMNQLYAIGVELDKTVSILENKVLEGDDSDSLKEMFIGYIINAEVSGWARFFEIKAQTVCEGSLDFDSNGDRKGKEPSDLSSF